MTDIRVLIIADDLTGSLDTGVHFAEAGLRTVVVGVEQSSAVPSGCDAVVVNTESRHVGAEVAARRVSRAGASFAENPGVIVYKKTDSTLRGNIAAEFAALLEFRPDRSIVFAPALPAQGRTTRNGVHSVHGTPLAETDFARDPVNPITTSVIAGILAGAATGPVVCCPPSDLESVVRGASPGSIIVADAETEDDLARIAHVCRTHAKRIIPAGSAGLANHLLTDMVGGKVSANSSDGRMPRATDGSPRPVPRPRILVSGSLNPVALSQSGEAIAHGAADIPLSPSDAAVLADSDAALTAPVSDLIARATEALTGGRDLCLRTVLNRDDAEEWSRRFCNEVADERPIHVSLPAAYGRLVRELVQGASVQTLVVFGGDTLHGILEALDVVVIEPIAQILPGVVWSEIDAGGARVTLITKAGGFGVDLPLVNTIFGE